VPALRLLPSPSPPRRLAPLIPLPDVPSVQFQDHLVGFQAQFQLGRRGPSRLRVQFGPHFLSPLSLTPGLAMQRAGRQLHPGQMLQHLRGFLHRHFAGQQRRQFLHRGRTARTVLQPQHRIGRKAPLLAPPTPAARAPQADRPKAGAKSALVALSQAAQRLVANWAAGRGGVGLGLGGGLDGPTLQFLGLALHLGFQMAEVLILGDDELLGSRFQVHGQFRRHHGQRSRTMRPTTRTDGSRRAGCFHAVVLPPTPTFVRSKTEMRRPPRRAPADLSRKPVADVVEADEGVAEYFHAFLSPSLPTQQTRQVGLAPGAGAGLLQRGDQPLQVLVIPKPPSRHERHDSSRGKPQRHIPLSTSAPCFRPSCNPNATVYSTFLLTDPFLTFWQRIRCEGVQATQRPCLPPSKGFTCTAAVAPLQIHCAR